jgi:hypothetical protein
MTIAIRLHTPINMQCYLHLHCAANAQLNRRNRASQPCDQQPHDKKPTPEGFRGLQKHACEYCSNILLSNRLKKPELNHSATLDLGFIEEAYRAGCVLYISLVNKLAESGRTLEDLLPQPTLYQDWETARYQAGRHLTLHLANGQQRFCDGVAYKIFSEDSEDHYSQS